MGSVLTPLFLGLERAIDLPHAATLCNQCGVVCPVRIPLPELLRKLREKQAERRLRPAGERLAWKLWGWLARRPALYGLGIRLAARYLRWLAAGGERIQVLSPVPAWTEGRDFPAPRGKTFRALYAERRA
jgi:L-lactate dehydrogenase complex protein LldF